MIQATVHWKMTTKMVQRGPSSRFTAAMAATHGVYNKQNTSMETAEVVVITAPMFSTPKVTTTFSLRMKPAINAVTTRQSPNPIGLNTGAKTPAMEANILSSLLLTRWNWKLNDSKNQMMMEKDDREGLLDEVFGFVP